MFRLTFLLSEICFTKSLSWLLCICINGCFLLSDFNMFLFFVLFCCSSLILMNENLLSVLFAFYMNYFTLQMILIRVNIARVWDSMKLQTKNENEWDTVRENGKKKNKTMCGIHTRCVCGYVFRLRSKHW